MDDFFNFLFLCFQDSADSEACRKLETWGDLSSSTKIISTKCQTFQKFLKVVFNQMSRRHIDGLTRMEVTLLTSSIQTTLSFPQRLMWVNVLDGFLFFWWHMVSLKRCYIMFVSFFQRHVVFQEVLPSIPWQNRWNATGVTGRRSSLVNLTKWRQK